MASVVASRSTPIDPKPVAVSTTAQSHPYTCNTCQVAFRSSELQRGHMRSDWHRYNLKRRVASLPPLSSEVFAEKVITAQATTAATAAKASFEKACTVCQKTYYSQNAYQNHLGSQKHQLNVVASQNGTSPVQADDETGSVMSSTFSLGDPVNIPPTEVMESVDPEAEAEFSEVVNGIKEATIGEDEPVSRRPSRPHHSSGEQRSEHPLSPIAKEKVAPTSDATTSEPPSDTPIVRCLFCNYESPSFKLNVHHMDKIHGMFIPEQPYLVELEGLINYLYKKISENYECLYCHRLKNSLSGVQTHMRDKGHCMIAFETEEEMIEVGQFYDFRSSYSDQDDDEDMRDEAAELEGGVKIGLKGTKTPKTVVTGENSNEEMDDVDEGGEGWETDEDEAEEPVPEEETSSARPGVQRRFSLIDSYHPNPRSPSRAAFSSDYELHLPSGRTAGHRSLARYYRQNLHSYPTEAERVQRRAIENARPSSDEDEDMANDDTPVRGRQVVTRADGGLGMLGVTDAKKREVQAVEKRDLKQAQRAQKQQQWAVDKKGNSQKHFRDPLLQ